MYGTEIVGRKVEVLWERGSENVTLSSGDPKVVSWYRGEIVKFDSRKCMHMITYEDGDEGWYKLDDTQFRFLTESKRGQESKERNTKPPEVPENYDGPEIDGVSDLSGFNDILVNIPLQQPSFPNALNFYHELARTAQLIKQRQRKVDFNETKLSKDLYRAEVLLTDEAAKISHTIECNVQEMSEELMKKLAKTLRRMKKTEKKLLSLQQQNVTVLNEKKQVESAREKLEQANKRLLSKLANASERIQKLEKKNRILKWREEKESVQQTPENNKHINSKSLNNSTRDKLRMEKPKLKTGNDAGETSAAEQPKMVVRFGSGNHNKHIAATNRQASMLQLICTLMENIPSNSAACSIKVFPGIAATLDMLRPQSSSIQMPLLEYCWKSCETHDDGISHVSTLSSVPGCQHLVQAILGLSNTYYANKTPKKPHGLNPTARLEHQESFQFLNNPSIVVFATSPLLSNDIKLASVASCLVLKLTRRVEYIGAALEALLECVKTDLGRFEFANKDGMSILMPILNSQTFKIKGHRRLIRIAVSILLTIVQDGAHLKLLKHQCGCESFFRQCAHLFTTLPGKLVHDAILNMPNIEVVQALSMLLEKMSRDYTCHKYFSVANLIPKLREWSLVLKSNTDENSTVFVMNVTAIIKRVKQSFSLNLNSQTSRSLHQERTTTAKRVSERTKGYTDKELVASVDTPIAQDQDVNRKNLNPDDSEKAVALSQNGDNDLLDYYNTLISKAKQLQHVS